MSMTQGKPAKPLGRRSPKPMPESDPVAKQPERKSRMPRPCAARRNIEEQIRGPGGYCTINLSAMHRACGQPPGKDPWTWARRAATVNAAVHQYKWGHIPSQLRYPPVHALTVGDDDDLGEFDYPYDCVTPHAEIALIYAVFLDGQLPEEISPASA